MNSTPLINRWIGWILLSLILGLQPRLHAVEESDLFEDRLIARSQNFEVRQSELDKLFISYQANLSTRGQRVPETRRSAVERSLLERLITTRLLVATATDAEKSTGKAKAMKLLEQQKSQAQSDLEFKRLVLSLGMTLEEFQKQLENQAISEEVLDRLLKDKTAISEEQVRDYYQQHEADFQYPEQVRVMHVLIAGADTLNQQPLPQAQIDAKKKLAESIRDQARSGKDFAQLVKEFSEDLASKDKGGEYTFPRGRMVPEFEAAAFSMEPGQISDVVVTKFGFHVIKLLEKIPSRLEAFDKVAPDIRSRLELIEIQKGIPAVRSRLMEEAGVEILLDAP